MDYKTDSRIDFRVTKTEKNLISKLADKQGMSMSDYIKYQVFDQNSDFSNDEHIYRCPPSDRLNYGLLGNTLHIFEMLYLLLRDTHGDKASELLQKAFERSRHRLENVYGYKKVKKDGVGNQGDNNK